MVVSYEVTFFFNLRLRLPGIWGEDKSRTKESACLSVWNEELCVRVDVDVFDKKIIEASKDGSVPDIIESIGDFSKNYRWERLDYIGVA